MTSRAALAFAGWMVCACKAGDPPAAAPPVPATRVLFDAAPAPDTAPLTLEPAHLYTLPPVPDGWTRLAAYDVEYQPGPCDVAIRVPGDMDGDLAGRSGGPPVPTPELVLERTVGTLRMTCSGYAVDRACVRAQCNSLRPVPGGSALDDYPNSAPMIALSVRDGDGRATRDVDIWPDGTVRYHGPYCTRYRGRRGRLTPEAYRALLAAIDASGVARLQESTREERARLAGCDDQDVTMLSIDGVARHAGCHPQPAIDAAIDAVRAAVDPNPCG